MRVPYRPARLLVAMAALILLVACGYGDDSSDADASGTTSTTEAEAADAEAVVQVVDSDLGEILASEGRTLYVFKPDNGGAPTCYDQCATNWPALLVEGDVVVGDDLDADLFDTVTRTDSGEQVTIDGWPLYFFANDAAPGDTNGQGVGSSWFVVGPDGAAIEG